MSGSQGGQGGGLCTLRDLCQATEGAGQWKEKGGLCSVFPQRGLGLLVWSNRLGGGVGVGKNESSTATFFSVAQGFFVRLSGIVVVECTHPPKAG